MDMQAEAYTLRNLGQENELRQQQIATARALEQQREADLRADQTFGDLLKNNATEQELYAANPRAAATYFKGQRENQKLEMEAEAQRRAAESSAANTRKTNRETESKEYEEFTNLLGTIKDESTFHTGLSTALARGYDPQMVRLVFQQGYRPEIIEQLKTSAMNEAAKKKLEWDLEEAEQKRVMRPLEADNLRNQVKTGTPDPVTNLTAAQAAVQQNAKDQRDFQATQNEENRKVQRRGQNMTDARTREMTEAARENKPLNEYETRNFGFFDRARQAENVLKGVEESISKKGTIGQIGMKLPNVIQSEENQIFEQAKRQFIAAYLRRDSGAVISPSEIAEADRTLFVQPGDGPEVIKQKRKARETITNSLKVGAGRAPERVDGAAPVSKMVKLVAPNGQTKEVSEAEAEHYLKLGAKRAN
jgi:hypothetical protein